MTWIYAMPFKGRHAILKYGAKLTGKAVSAINSDSIINFTIRSEPLTELFRSDALVGWLGSSKITGGLGTPNVILRSLESSPGVWWLKDQETSWEFLVFSDGWKKKPWKGSSIEVVSDTGDEQELHLAFARLVACLAYTSTYYGWVNQNLVKDLVRQSLGVKP